MILNVPGKVTMPKDKVELNVQTASATVPTLCVCTCRYGAVLPAGASRGPIHLTAGNPGTCTWGTGLIKSKSVYAVALLVTAEGQVTCLCLTC